jgi:transcription elongation factor Elf1
MEQYFDCPLCGEHSSVYIDPDDGDQQELVAECPLCGQPTVVLASFDYPSSRYEIRVFHEAAGR